jgi:diguanylate cyclase (GGDEF)-like protein/PAS domain S-box-containing protein
VTAFDDFSTLFDLLPIGAYRSTADGRWLRANASLVALMGCQSEAHLLSTAGLLNEWYVEVDRRSDFVQRVLRDGEVKNFVSEVFRSETRERLWISENAHAVRDPDGNLQFFEGTIEDITNRILSKQSLIDSERRYRALMQKAQVATAIVDESGRVLFATAATRELFGYEPNAFVGQNIFDSMHEDDLALHRAEFASVASHCNTGRESVARHRHIDGTFRYLASIANDARDDHAIAGIVLNWRDVTDATLAQRRLQELADTDALTALNNRSYFESLTSQLLERAEAAGLKLALYFIDLNRFKLVNDSYGHYFGDRVLRVIADRLRTHMRSGDVVARIGGDEFAVLCAAESRDEALRRGREWLRAIDTSVQIEHLRFELGASVGVSLFPDHGKSLPELLSNADLAMFHAKSRRSSAVEAFNPMMTMRSRAQLSVATELHAAIERHEIEPFFQPIVDLGNGQWCSMEVLARWRHPTRGLLPPIEFIPAAEDQGLIGQVGQVMVSAAMAQLVDWRKRFAPDLRMSINVAAQELQHDVYVERMLRLLAQHHLPPQSIMLEVTEGSMLASDIDVDRRIAALRDGGVLIALDDLGVGYSTLEYFRRFPIDVVKVDKGFISGALKRKVDAAIVKALTTLAKNLSVLVVAEGIEREEQQAFAVDVGCHMGQGFHYSPPLAATDIEAMFLAGSVRLPPTFSQRPSWELPRRN